MLRSVLVIPVALALSLTLLPAVAAAQGAEIVELDDGSFVRGTIVERVEGSHLIVQTVTGELRRVELARVTYAGPVEGRTRHADGTPASRLGSPVPPPPSAYGVPARAARDDDDEGDRTSRSTDVEIEVRARGARRDLVLHVMTGTATGSVSRFGQISPTTVSVDAFRPVCVAPCTTDLHRGAYVFGIGVGGSRARRIGGTPVQIDRPLTLEIDYSEHAGERALGWVVFVAGLLGGGALAIAPLYSGMQWDLALGAGLGTFGLTTLIALPLMFMNDGTHLRVLEPRF